MANYQLIPRLLVAEKWTGDNHSVMFEFLTWDVWDKRDNSASGTNFSIDNSEEGDGVLYINEIDTVAVGDYVVREDNGSLSVMSAVDLESQYIRS